jgi:major vault protein
VETADFVRATIKVSYCVNFDPAYKDKWFDVDNYVKYLCDRVRSLVKREAKKYNIEEFWQNYSDIIRNVAIQADKKTEDGKHKGRFFSENGMYIHDCEVLSIDIESSIANLLNERQYENVSKGLQLSDAEKRVKIAEALALAEKKEQEVRNETLINQMKLKKAQALEKIAIDKLVSEKEAIKYKAEIQAKKDLQPLLDSIAEAELARRKTSDDYELEKTKAAAEVEKAKQMAYAEAVVKTLGAVQPGLVEALTSTANADVLKAVSQGIAPYAMAKDEGVADFINKLMRGTTLENVLTNITTVKE